MARWPAQPERVGLGQWVIAAGHPFSLGAGLKPAMGDGSITGSNAWPSANRALFIPFRLPQQAIAYQMVVGCGATAAGNFDAGIYDTFGNRLVSSGATAKTSSTEVVCDITNTTIGPGLYYIALAADGTNNYISSTSATAAILKIMGVLQASSAYTLPSTVTFETVASAYIPAVSVWLTAK